METDSDVKGSFATVPLKWVIITKKDGTGSLSKQRVGETIAAMNKYFNAGDPKEITEEVVKKVNA